MRKSVLVKKTILLSLFCLSSVILRSQDKGFKFIDYTDKNQIDVTYNGKLLTAYCYFDSVMKPILFPVNTVSGTTVTRGFPIAPRAGEKVDHPHHTGLWLNYEYVNDYDFWNNSTAIPFSKRNEYGTIKHESVLKSEAHKNEATLVVAAQWIKPDKQSLLSEITRYIFHVVENNFVIDRITTLKAEREDVHFNDVKDGFFAIRVARELEQPSNEPQTFVDNKGNYTTIPAINNEGVSGEYLSSEKLKGDSVWGTRGRWVSLQGVMKKKPVSITIIDHPKNIGYPTYWHARGYGLFAANPLGQEVFSKGKEKLNFKLKKGESVTFRFRVVVHEGSELTTSAIEKWVKEFGRIN